MKQIAKVGDIVVTKWDNGTNITGIISSIDDRNIDGDVIGIPSYYFIYNGCDDPQSLEHDQIVSIKGNIFDIIS